MEDLRAAGQEVHALENKPELAPDLAYILRLFQLISHSRPPAFSGISGIRITDIEAVYRLCAVIIMDPDEFIDWMLFLDSVTIAWHAEHKKEKPDG